MLVAVADSELPLIAEVNHMTSMKQVVGMKGYRTSFAIINELTRGICRGKLSLAISYCKPRGFNWVFSFLDAVLLRSGVGKTGVQFK